MKNRIMHLNGLAAFAFGLVFLSILSCSPKSDPEIVQGADHWLVLDVDRAKHTEEGLSWDFLLTRPGKYDVQLIFDGELESSLPEIELQTGDLLLKEAPEKIFTIGSKGNEQSVFQYSKGFTFKETGTHSLNIIPQTSLKAVRFIPDHRKRIGFGSDKYYDEWLTMHNSEEKQAGIAWLKEAKYGMFIHWGLYSQAGGIWEGVHMENSGIPGPGVSEWLMYKFQIPRNEYEKLAKEFNPDKSFAANIARLAKDAGMKYIVITSKHHDGFALFDSECSDYDMVDRTPYKADAIKELYDACLEEGLDFGVYYSHGNDWYDGSDGNYNKVKRHNDSLGILSTSAGKNTWDPSPNTHAEYLENKAYPQIEELVKMMPDLRVIWFDGDGYITEEQAFRFYKLVYDLNPHVLVNRRVGYDFGDYLDAGDNVIPSASDKMTKYWETCGTTNNSWAYKSYDNDFKSVSEMLYYLVDIASKGGNYLLNIGPDGKGHVPDQSAAGLREIGQWLEVNGDAIYGTSAWIVSNEGQSETLLEGTGHRAAQGFSRTFTTGDFWFTSKNNKVYAIALLPAEDTVRIKALKKETGTIQNVRLLGSDKAIPWVQTETELQLDFRGVDTSENGFAIELTF
ncbi:MAG: alpha-L-fucosidase [Bacteroides sp.]|nr:alpha-L-fucosidase [Bacteroides sp.]